MESHTTRNGKPPSISYYGPGEEDLVHINVSGTTFTTLKRTLSQFPRTLLGDENRLKRHYVRCLKAYFFDRHRGCFEAILYYYQSGGYLIRPNDIPMDLFEKEVQFFGISEEVLKNLQKMEGYVPIETGQPTETATDGFQQIAWKLLEYPETSLTGKVIASFSVLMILVSIVTFCLESLPEYHSYLYEIDTDARHNDHSNGKINCSGYQARSKNGTGCDSPIRYNHSGAIDIIELVTVIWFTLEYMIRFAASPDKWIFFKSFMNLIDLFAILPYYIVTAMKSYAHAQSLAIIRVIRLIRVLRIFKLSRHSMGLQTLGSTLKTSLNELGMILFVLSFSIIIFSSAIYYAELDSDVCVHTHACQHKQKFSSIPDVFWYSLVTMTTVGYGDYVPLTPVGKIVGGLCAISGVVTIAMVVPVVVTNFEFFYKRDRMTDAYRERDLLSIREAVHPNNLFHVSEITPDEPPGRTSYHSSV